MNFPNVLRRPDQVFVTTNQSKSVLAASSEGAFENGDVQVITSLISGANSATGLKVTLQSTVPVRTIQLRWSGEFAPSARFLGDAWERGYGDLEWRGLVPQRVMPWTFLVFDGEKTSGYGVDTQPNALCHWKTDAGGITLCLDVKSGSGGVELGERILEVSTVRSVHGTDESPFEISRQLNRALCANPRLPRQPVYGGNDWYYAYGDNSRASILRDAQNMSELAPDGPNRPFMVIDDGWQECRFPWNGGPWHRGSAQFGSMETVAKEMKAVGTRPGIWFRPLLSVLNVPLSWRFNDRLPAHAESLPLDPSVPEALEIVAADVSRFRDWGYELVKHDFSTFDIFWRWGFTFGEDPTFYQDGPSTPWSFADKTRTTAEITKTLYQTMRDAAGEEMYLLGCNTIGHLGAGIFEIQRTGDDTSGRDWERTRKMGINTLAFRMTQHDAFFAVDADCVGLTNEVPWELNRQWLDLLARSGTPLFVSADPAALGTQQKAALREAFIMASQTQPVAEPLDWLDTTCPAIWRCGDETHAYKWFDTTNLL